MAAANITNSFSNLKFSNVDSNILLLFSRSNNSFYSNLDFTIAPPKHIALKPTEVFNQTISAKEEDIKKSAVISDVKDQALLGPLVLNGAGVIAEFSGHIRQVYSTYHQVYGTEDPTALAALGMTTGFNLVSGGLNVKSALDEVKTAEKVSDTVGKTLANLKIVRGAAQATGGAVFIPVRALSIAALLTSSKIVSTIAGILGSIGDACFNLVSSLALIGTSIRLHEQRLFRNELDLILKDPHFTEEERAIRALEHLKQRIAVSSTEREEIQREIAARPEFESLSPQQIAEKVEEKANLLLQKKEECLKRLIDENCLTQIRQKGLSEASSVIEAVQKKSKEKVILNSLSVALLVVGLVISIASFIFTGPIGIIVTTALGLAVSLTWLLVDGYGLIKEFKSSDPGRFDKLCIFISSVIAVVSIATVFFVSGGIAPMIIAAVIGAFWLGINIACYYRLYQLKKENPSQVQTV